MAGLTKVQAASQMLASVGMGRISALPTPGDGSDADDAVAVLEQAIDEFIIAGHPNTTKAASAYTASAAGEVDLSSLALDILAVIGHGAQEGKKLTLRGTKVYDQGKGTTQAWASGEAGVILEIRYKPSSSSPNDFEDLDPGLRVAIMKHAIRLYQFQKMRNTQADAFYEAQQIASARAGVGGTDRRVETMFGAPPLPLVGGAGGQQGMRGQ